MYKEEVYIDIFRKMGQHLERITINADYLLSRMKPENKTIVTDTQGNPIIKKRKL